MGASGPFLDVGALGPSVEAFRRGFRVASARALHNLVLSTTNNIVNREISSSAYLTLRVRFDSYKLISTLLNIGAKINLLPLLYYNYNILLYILLSDITFTVYNGESLSLIGVTKE
jgi:hypothetical protein